MGMFDYYEGVQIKRGPRTLHSYKIGDEVPLEDGIYISYEGAIVILGKKLVASFDDICTKWEHDMPMFAGKVLHQICLDTGWRKHNFCKVAQRKPRVRK